MSLRALLLATPLAALAACLSPGPDLPEYHPDAYTVALWHLNEGPGNTAQDASRHFHTLYTHGASPGFSTDGKFASGWAFYNNGGGLYSPVPAAFASNELTYEFWVYPVTGWIFPSGYWKDSAFIAAGPGMPLVFTSSTPSSLALGFDDPSRSYTSALLGTTLAWGYWQHVVCTYDGSTLALYRNGMLVAVQHGIQRLLPGASFLALGTAPDRPEFDPNINFKDLQINDRRIDEVRISSVARSAAEIGAPSGVTPVVPAAPSALVASPLDSTTVQLTWSPPSADATAVSLQQAPGPAGPWTWLATLSPGDVVYRDSVLPGSARAYRLRAWGTHGASDWVMAVAKTPPASEDPLGTPTVPDAEAISTTAIRVTWHDNSTAETGFDVEVATSTDGPWSSAGSVGANVTTFDHGGLSPGVQYFYRVRATNDSGSSPYSLLATARTWRVPTPYTADANTLALWHLDEGTGQLAADASGHGNALTLGSTAGVDPDDPSWTTGQFGGALESSGIVAGWGVGEAWNPSCVLPFSYPPSGKLTVEAWVLADATARTGGFQALGSGWEISLSGDSQVLLFCVHAPGLDNMSSCVMDWAGLDGDGWHHLAGVWDNSASSVSMFVDGQLRPGDTMKMSGVVSKLGCGIVNLAGKMDEVRVLDVALTPAEIAADVGR
jgi:hypothetical protein